MVENADRRRSVEVRVKLSPALAEEFGAIAAGRGLLPATLAAAAIGEYVEKYRQSLQTNRMVALEMARRMAVIDEEKIGQAIALAISDPGMRAALSDLSSEAGATGG